VANYFTVLFDRSHTHTNTWYKKQFTHFLPTCTVKVTIVYNKPSSFSVFKATKDVRRKFVNKLYSDWGEDMRTHWLTAAETWSRLVLRSCTTAYSRLRKTEIKHMIFCVVVTASMLLSEMSWPCSFVDSSYTALDVRKKTIVTKVTGSGTVFTRCSLCVNLSAQSNATPWKSAEEGANLPILTLDTRWGVWSVNFIPWTRWDFTVPTG
jgi:hypothetical protein